MGILLMSLKILIKEKGRFPQYMIGHNKEMHKLGISCVKHDEIKCHNKGKKGSDGCASCC